jgi:hypothetical protein
MLREDGKMMTVVTVTATATATVTTADALAART